MDEVKAGQKKETRHLVRPYGDWDVTSCKWVYSGKLGPTGEVRKYETCSVATCFKNEEVLEFWARL